MSYPLSTVVGVETSTDGQGLSQLLADLQEDGRIVHVERFAAQPARYGSLDQPLPDELVESLPFDRFFTHQAEAIDRLRAGESVAIATGTASGKSLCYQVPIAESAVEHRGRSTSLLLFPTKALAQDQLRSLGGLGVEALKPATYDGDTPLSLIHI